MQKKQQQLTNWIAFFGLSIYWDLAPNIAIYYLQIRYYVISWTEHFKL